MPNPFNPRFTLALMILVLFAYGNWVSSMPSNRPRPVDAVVVHAGGEGERLDRALELMEDDRVITEDAEIPALVLMRGTAPEWPEANELCANGADGFDVLCPLPDPDSTIGEAQALSLLVRQRGWEEVIAVTSDYHLRRATHLDRECNPDLVVYAAGANSPLDFPSRLQRIVWEMGGMVQAALTC